MKLQAVCFDFDGIVVDSEPLHFKAFARVFDPVGLSFSWERYCEHYLGFDDRDVLRERFKDAGRVLDAGTMQSMMEEKARTFVALVEQDGVTPYPGVVNLIRSLQSIIPLAICSGALSSDIEPILRILGIADCFATRVTADQVHVSKPDPESYIEAFRRLQQLYPVRVTDAGCCFAIEDTPAGISAAKGAGLKTLAVCNTYPAQELTSADVVVSSLADVTPVWLDQHVS